MNSAQLLAQFDRISDAPDAIPRLRRFILDLAVRGKLVEQDPRDEPASELLTRIQKEKALLVKAGKLKLLDPVLEISDQEKPFSTPSSWAWTRLANTSRRIHYGFTASANQSLKTVRLLRITDIQNNLVDWSSVPGCEITADEVAQYRLDENDILIARTGGTIGKTFLVRQIPVTAVFASYLIRVQPSAELHAQYLKVFLESSVYWEQLQDGARGGGQPNVNGQTLRRMILPIPPRSEQYRIVAKVDELMALCDRLEAAQEERESRRDRLVTSSLNRLNNNADADAFLDHARFYFNHLPRLTTRPEYIQQLRQAILNLAVRGQFTPATNWPEQPQSLNQFATLQNGYAFKSEWFVSNGVRLLRNANVSHGMLRWDDLACLPQKRCAEFERFQLSNGDIVLSLDRPFIATGTKVARVRPEDLPCLLLQRVGRFQPRLEQLCPDYLFLWLHSPHFTGQIDPGRSNGVPHISSKQVESAEIFVPSLTEQHRIVTKVDELMALCDRLETQLTTTHTESRRLLEAVLHEALTEADHQELAATSCRSNIQEAESR